MNVVNFDRDDLEVALALGLVGLCLGGGAIFGGYALYLIINALLGGGF
jgi:hypothetical protein